MALPVPEWLSRRGGTVKVASDGQTRLVMLDGAPQFSVVPRPVGGKVGCFILQTNSGQPVASTSTAATPEEAVTAGLEDLRNFLGW
jgi:hypothetical protein